MEYLELERVKQSQNMLVKYSQLVETIIRPTEQVRSSSPASRPCPMPPRPLLCVPHPLLWSMRYGHTTEVIACNVPPLPPSLLCRCVRR